jgi:hypothetical protein
MTYRLGIWRSMPANLLQPVVDAVVSRTAHAMLTIALQVDFPMPSLAICSGKLMRAVVANVQDTAMFVFRMA